MLIQHIQTLVFINFRAKSFFEQLLPLLVIVTNIK